jgi:hypothetical protein
VRGRSLLIVVVLLVGVAACGGGADYGEFCDVLATSGGVTEQRTGTGVEQLEYFGTEQHLDDLQRIQQAIPEEDERVRDAIQVFIDWVRDDYEPRPGAPNPASWPGEIRVAYDRLTSTATSECKE